MRELRPRRHKHLSTLAVVAVAVTLAMSDSRGPHRTRPRATTPIGTSTTTAVPTRTTAATPAPTKGRSRPIYWGASIGTQFAAVQPPWNMSGVTSFERLSGKPLSILNWYTMFYSQEYCDGYCRFDAGSFNSVRSHGEIPFVSWASLPATGAFTDAQIAAGSQDSYISRWATSAKNWGHPLFLRLDWEMNGSWFPWGVGANGNRAADYVAMWRHVHDLFVAAGATNVSFVWSPSVDVHKQLAPLASLYPGDAYVDWTSLDGYNSGTNPAGNTGGWLTFDQVYRSTYRTVTNTIAPSKPMILAEVGSTEDGGSKAAWITDMLTVQLPHNYPKIHGFLWHDENAAGMDWPIESSPAATKAFANAIASRRYTTNSFGSLGGSKISPPHKRP